MINLRLVKFFRESVPFTVWRAGAARTATMDSESRQRLPRVENGLSVDSEGLLTGLKPHGRTCDAAQIIYLRVPFL